MEDGLTIHEPIDGHAVPDMNIASDMTRLRLVAHAALISILIFVFLAAHASLPSGPTPPWSVAWDQSRYITASAAWSILDLSPSRHWYPPGYSILGALFERITPYDSFLVPNIACLVISQLASASIARRMFPDWRNAGPLGAIIFLTTTIGTSLGLLSWLVPWTTTPATATILLALIAALRLIERPNLTRALLAGTAIGAIAFFRPSDAVPVAIAAELVVVPYLIQTTRKNAFAVVGGLIFGFLTASGTTAVIIAITSGFGADTYYDLSSRYGFELGLIPSRWITLFLSGNPIYDGVGTPTVRADLHAGLAENFPWIIFGIGGMAACLVGGRVRTIHVLLCTWLILHVSLMLSYRDLHISGLWLYWNYHYFKPIHPILAMYAVFLIRNLLDGPLSMRSAIALGAMIVASCWRVDLVPTGTLVTPVLPGPVLLPSMDHLDDAVIVPGNLSWSTLDTKTQQIQIGSVRYQNSYDFRIYRRRHDLIIVPLRHLASGRGKLHAPGLKLSEGTPIRAAKQELVFGLPCLFSLAGQKICGELGAPVLP